MKVMKVHILHCTVQCTMYNTQRHMPYVSYRIKSFLQLLIDIALVIGLIQFISFSLTLCGGIKAIVEVCYPVKGQSTHNV